MVVNSNTQSDKVTKVVNRDLEQGASPESDVMCGVCGCAPLLSSSHSSLELQVEYNQDQTLLRNQDSL